MKVLTTYKLYLNFGGVGSTRNYTKDYMFECLLNRFLKITKPLALPKVQLNTKTIITTLTHHLKLL